MFNAEVGRLFSILLLMAAGAAVSHELCLNTGGPSGPQDISFCSAYRARGCCGPKEDARLAARFAAMGLEEDQACRKVLQRVLCSECDPRSHFFFNSNGSAPFLCPGSSCQQVYTACKDLRISGNPFAPLGRSIADTHPSLAHFASAHCKGPAGKGRCWGKAPSEVRKARVLQSTSKLCFERLSSGAPLNLEGHPAAAGYAVMGDQAGLLQLVALPPVGSGKALRVVSTYLDLRARVLNSGERGLLSFAFHPKFLANGRVFVSYICDGSKVPDCQGPCACNSAIGCTLGARGAGCTSNTVIAEYRVARPRNVFARPSAAEVHRIMTYGRPFGNHNGGHIFFGMSGNLFVTSGDGGSGGDPFNAAQNGASFLGKIHRINVDKTSRGRNYSIPGDNPFVGRRGVLPEIYALGLRNPWRCTRDLKLGHIFCADVGQNTVEEVDLIQAGFNYGWSHLEGTRTYSSGVQTSLGKRVQGPVFQYAHTGVQAGGIPEGGDCVIGGVVYRARRNTCLQGKYLYNDLNGNMWVGTVYPAAGKKPSTMRVALACSPKSPVACNSADFGSMWSWGQDSLRDAYVLSGNGVYRLVDLSRCGLKC